MSPYPIEFAKTTNSGPAFGNKQIFIRVAIKAALVEYISKLGSVFWADIGDDRQA